MLNAQLLHKIRSKHPELSNIEIRFIIRYYLSVINRKLSICQTIDLNIPKLGRIHTHGNAINKRKVAYRKYHKKNMNKVNLFTDKALLF